jgi:flagellar assembly protein FliH
LIPVAHVRLEAEASARRSSAPPPSSGRISAVHASAAVEIRSTREVELEAQNEALRAEIARLAGALASLRARVVEESEPEIVRLAMAIASRVVGRELSADPSMIAEWIGEARALLPGRSEIVVAVAPDVAAHVPAERIEARLGDGAGTIVVDPTLRPGTCELREGPSTVEVGAEARLDALADALGLEPS